MDHLRAIRLSGQIESQKRIKAQFEEEGNEVGAKRAERKIKQLQKELDNLG
jgi:hypothetical protein